MENTFRESIEEVFGEYTPVTETSTDGSIHYVQGVAGLDVPWIAGFTSFCLGFVMLIVVWANIFRRF